MPIRTHRLPTASPAWRVGFLLCGAALVAFAGCEKDGIQHYQVPKPPMYRLLGAIVPHGDTFWFFKLTGPEDTVKEHKQEFDAFLNSLTFAAGDKPTWKLPAGWEEKPGDEMRFATLVLGPAKDPLELTVTKLGRDPAENSDRAVLDNVNRWRRQMGLMAIEADRLAETAPPRDLHGVTARVVDMVGPKPGKTGRGGMGMPPARPAPRPKAPPAEEPGLHYTKPAGWKEPAEKKPARIAEFVVEDGGRTAEVTVTAFPGAVGGLVANVNRWRGQVGLPEASEAEVRRSVTPLAVGGNDSSFVDLSSPDDRQRMLVVLVPRGERTWFFKMMGPADLVGRQKAAFEAFVKSVRFD